MAMKTFNPARGSWGCFGGGGGSSRNGGDGTGLRGAYGDFFFVDKIGF